MIFYIMGVKREEGRRGGRGRGGVCCVGGVGAVWWRVAAVSSTQGRGCCIGLKQEGGGGRGEAWETRGRRLCVSVGEEGGGRGGGGTVVGTGVRV